MDEFKIGEIMTAVVEAVGRWEDKRNAIQLEDIRKEWFNNRISPENLLKQIRKNRLHYFTDGRGHIWVY